MDPQKQFLASTLQGAFEAEVLSSEDLFRHLHSAVLAEHVPPEILWACLTEGMVRAGLGPTGGAPPRAGEAHDTVPPQPAPSDEAAAAEPPAAAEEPIAPDAPAAEVAEPPAEPSLEDELGPPPGGSIDIDVTEALDDLPPLPDDELSVEEVDWDENK